MSGADTPELDKEGNSVKDSGPSPQGELTGATDGGPVIRKSRIVSDAAWSSINAGATTTKVIGGWDDVVSTTSFDISDPEVVTCPKVKTAGIKIRQNSRELIGWASRSNSVSPNLDSDGEPVSQYSQPGPVPYDMSAQSPFG